VRFLWLGPSSMVRRIRRRRPAEERQNGSEWKWIYSARRGTLRAGAVAAAGAAGASILSASSAAAAPGDNLVLGRGNDAGADVTAVSSTSPDLALARVGSTQRRGEEHHRRASDRLDPDGFGVRRGYLVTNLDFQDFATHMPMLYTVTPTRMLDTRTAEGRANIVNGSPGAIGPEGHLMAGAWIDVTLGDAALVAVGVVDGQPAVRISTTRRAHVALDITGRTARSRSPCPARPGSRGDRMPRSPR
jgi:hypothetical protein